MTKDLTFQRIDAEVRNADIARLRRPPLWFQGIPRGRAESENHIDAANIFDCETPREHGAEAAIFKQDQSKSRTGGAPLAKRLPLTAPRDRRLALETDKRQQAV